MSHIDLALRRARGENPEPAEAAATERRREPDETTLPSGVAASKPPVSLAETAMEKVALRMTVEPACNEQYRRLAATLHHAQLELGTRVLMVVSAAVGEGKTLTASNLAVTLSESYGRQVLLVDADLRRPSLHALFGVPNVSGLSDALSADQQHKLPVLQLSRRLTLLTAGPPDPQPLSSLTSERLRMMIEQAATHFEWVIVDTPPVALMPDARLLTSFVRSVVLVVEAGRTPYRIARKAIEAIGRDRIMGIVLNRVEDKVIAAAGAYDRYHYPGYGSRAAQVVSNR